MALSKSDIIIEGQQKPDFPKELFWDWRYNEIDWQKTYRSIIERVLERGTKDEWKELNRFYGETKIIAALRKEILLWVSQPAHSSRARRIAVHNSCVGRPFEPLPLRARMVLRLNTFRRYWQLLSQLYIVKIIYKMLDRKATFKKHISIICNKRR
jgi:hypothetical protein